MRAKSTELLSVGVLSGGVSLTSVGGVRTATACGSEKTVPWALATAHRYSPESSKAAAATVKKGELVPTTVPPRSHW